ncbi:MAG: alpha/beta hydrolase-fold protein [Bacteroidota bacterium]
MQKYLLALFLLASLPLSPICAQGNAQAYTERHSFLSTYLQEERSFQVYLPPSYFYNDKSNFPVIYLIDGDYNFYYDTGLIEFMSSVSCKIPEMIVVGISDRGNEGYRRDCTPTASEGNADNFMDFIEKELKAQIKQRYRTSDYDLLIGHSLGGFFATHFLLQRPKAFDTYIAIDPSYWWGDYEISSRADSLFAEKEDLDAQLFISLASTKMMGVRQFVGVLDKHFPNSTKWDFQHYPEENHGSVGIVTVKHALRSLFKGWDLSREEFLALKGAKAVVEHYKQLSDKFSTSFPLPAYAMGNMVYYYHREDKAELEIFEKGVEEYFPSSLDEFRIQVARNYLSKEEHDQAEAIYKLQIQNDLLSFRSYEGLAKIYQQKGELAKAQSMSAKAVEAAKKAKVRQWQLNEILSTHRKIQNGFQGDDLNNN